VVLQFFRDGDAILLAAANDGGASYPGWYHNLIADPIARVEVMGRTFAVRAEELPPAEAADAWDSIILPRAPSYRPYLRATTRVMPVLRLGPVSAKVSQGPR
jgi:deazaflavin-dependent oxidoreductase (nitroreductase family)